MHSISYIKREKYPFLFLLFFYADFFKFVIDKMIPTEKTLQNEENISDEESMNIPSNPQDEKPNEITRVTKSKAKRIILLIS
jgi:hypothetical protein